MSWALRFLEASEVGGCASLSGLNEAEAKVEAGNFGVLKCSGRPSSVWLASVISPLRLKTWGIHWSFEAACKDEASLWHAAHLRLVNSEPAKLDEGTLAWS